MCRTVLMLRTNLPDIYGDLWLHGDIELNICPKFMQHKRADDSIDFHRTSFDFNFSWFAHLSLVRYTFLCRSAHRVEQCQQNK